MAEKATAEDVMNEKTSTNVTSEMTAKDMMKKKTPRSKEGTTVPRTGAVIGARVNNNLKHPLSKGDDTELAVEKRTKKSLKYQNGDRYCSSCGNVVFGFAKEKKAKCPHKNCEAPVPYRENMWKFAKNGWSRCDGYLCGAFIEDIMKYCEWCGFLNGTAFEKLERLEKSRASSEKFKLTTELKNCQSEYEKAMKKIKELEDTVAVQESEIFKAKVFVNQKNERESQDIVNATNDLLADSEEYSMEMDSNDVEK